MPNVGLLWDSVSDNAGDRAIGVFMQRALSAHHVDFCVVDPFEGTGAQPISSLVIGGGELIRTPGHPFYDVFRVPGAHVLNTVGVLDGAQTEYLDQYALVTVRSRADQGRLGRGTIAPCLSLLYQDYLPEGKLNLQIPEDAIGIHVNFSLMEQYSELVTWLVEAHLGPIVWLSLTPYNADEATMQVMAERVPNSTLISGCTPDEIFRLISHLRVLVSSSLHAMLFAYAQGVPFLGYSSIGKIRAFLQDRNLDSFGFTQVAQLKTRLPTVMDASQGELDSVEADRERCRQVLNQIVNHCREVTAVGGGGLRYEFLPASRIFHEAEMRSFASQGQTAARLMKHSFELIDRQREKHASRLHDEIQQLHAKFSQDLAKIREDYHEIIFHLQNQLRGMKSMQAWRLVTFWYRVKDKLLPPGSIGARIYERIRGWILQLRAGGYHVLDPSYAALLRRTLPDERAIRRQALEAKRLAEKPLLSLVTVIKYDEPAFLDEMIQSMQHQTYANWEWILADQTPTERFTEMLHAYAAEDGRIRPSRFEGVQSLSGATNSALRAANGDYIASVGYGDVLTPDALFSVVDILRQYPETDIIYSDYDHIDGERRLFNPLFKPDWSPEFMLSFNLLQRFCFYKSILLAEVGYLDPDHENARWWDLALRMGEKAAAIRHIPRPIYHMRAPKPMRRRLDHGDHAFRRPEQAVLRKHLERRGIQSPVIEERSIGGYKIGWDPQRAYKISIVIPSCDQAAVLERCLQTIYHLTSFDDFEILLVDTGSQQGETWDLYDRYASTHKFKVVRFEESFNFSKACNLGAQSCDSDLILFLNNDTEILDRDWLQRMSQWFDLKGVGVVGAKLLYPDGKLQHAGVIVGLGGLASHLFQNEYEYVTSIFGSEYWYRNLSAVTAACMLISREAYQAVEGFDEGYHLNYSDVDMCLRVVQSGRRIVYSPDVRLIHHEAKTHGKRIPRTDFERASERWRSWGYLEGDPYFNPNLSYMSAYPVIQRSGLDTPSRLNERLMARMPQKEILQLPEDLR